jgi:hypothetical protein
MTVQPIGRRRPRRAFAPTALVSLLLAAVLAGGLLWVAGELHYRSCVKATGAKYAGNVDDLTRLVRNTELAKCSRSPF